MAIIALGVTVVGIRGTIGGIIFSANKATPYAKAWARGSNPKTLRQSTQRGLLATMPALWRDLTDAERVLWDVFAALPAQDLINSLGETYSISGFGWFNKINIRLLVMGRATRTAVPSQARPSAPSITDIEFPFDVGQTAFVTYASATFDPDFDLVLEIAQSASIGRIAAPSVFAEFAVLQNPDDTETGFASAYVNRLGIGNASLRGYARLYRQTTDGLRSSPGAAQFITSDAPNYAPTALDYNGSADFALRGADLTGAAESKVLTIAGWFKIDGGDGNFRNMQGSTGNTYEIRLTNANKFQIRLENNVGTDVATFITDDAILAGSTWHSFLFSCDTNTLIVHWFIDDAPVDFTTQTFTVDQLIDFSVADHSFGARLGGSFFWDGCLSNWWFSIADALDFSDVAIRRIFISPAGDPLDLGSAGQLPTGTPPIIYLPDGDASNNVGDGGNYTNQAGTSACSTSP